MADDACTPPRLALLGDSFLYACHSLRSRACRHSATIVCALTPTPLTVCVGRQRWTGRLLAVRPFVARSIDSEGQPQALLDLEPTHLRFNSFCTDGPAVRVLDDTRFAGLLHCARAFAAGELTGRRLQASVQFQLQAVADSLAPLRPLDARVLSMMAALRLDPSRSLNALAEAVALSPAHASHTFADSLGITVRQYALAVKIQRAAMFFGSGRALTDIAQLSGFTDSAHLARVWTRCYGASPSHYFAARGQAAPAQVDHAWRQTVRLAAA